LYQVSAESNLQELFQFAVSRGQHLVFRSIAFTIIFLLALFKKRVRNISFQPADKRHI